MANQGYALNTTLTITGPLSLTLTDGDWRRCTLEMFNEDTHETLAKEPDFSWLKEPTLKTLFSALMAKGATARVVGGAVRDTLEGLPVKDIDIAIDVPPQETIELLEAAHIKVIPTGIDYGTVTAILDKKPYQITSLRQDTESYGRKADVAFVKDWEADAQRRDFTINAIYANPDGTLYDPCGGIEDLKNADVKFIGNAEDRVQEDYLRILRFFRFSCIISPYYLDPEGEDACHTYAAKLNDLSKERVTEEFTKILLLETPSDVLSEMAPELEQIFTKPVDIDSLIQLEYFEAVYDFKIMFLTRLAALIDSVDDIKLLLLSKEQTKLLATLLKHKHEASLDHRLCLYTYGKELTSLLLHMLAAKDPKRLYPRVEPMIKECEEWVEKALPLSGEDLMKLGIPQGQKVGELLEKVERWWIRKNFKPDHKACLAYAKRMLGEE